MFDQEFHNARKQYESLSKEQQAKFVNDNHNNAKVQEFARNYARYQAQGRPDFQVQQQTQQSQQQPPQQTVSVQETQQDQPQYQESQQGQQQEVQSQGGMQKQVTEQQTQGAPQFGYQTDEVYRKQRDAHIAQTLYTQNPNSFDYDTVYRYVRSEAQGVSDRDIHNTVRNIQSQYLQYGRLGAMKTGSVEKLREGLMNGQYSQSDLELLKTQDPERYNEYIAHEEKMNAMSNAKHNAMVGQKLMDGKSVKEERKHEEILVEKAREYFGVIDYKEEIIEQYKESLNAPEIQKHKNKMLDAQREMDEIDDSLDTLREDLMKQYPGIPKTQLNAILQDRSYKLLKRKNELHRDYVRSKGEVQFAVDMAGKNLEADLKGIEIQRMELSDKMQALGFAKGLMEFETPQQKRDAELEQIRKKAELQAELSDINSKDPKIQFNAVMQALDQYYKDFGSIILRPQAQAAQDIIDQAKREKISVGEAMRKNFTEELFKKPEYKTMVNKQIGYDPNQNITKIGDKSYITSYNPDGTINIQPFYGDQTTQSFVGSGMKGAGLRNNNPGNIKDMNFGNVIGKDHRGFAQFATPEDGFDALVEKIKFNQNSPQSRYYGKTIAEYFKLYAPSNDGNNPVAYANSVAKQLGVSVNTKISQLDPVQFARHIAKHDSGYDYSTYGQFRGQGGNLTPEKRAVVQDIYSSLMRIFPTKSDGSYIPGFEGAVGSSWQKLFGGKDGIIAGTDAASYKTNFDNFINLQVLPNLSLLKGAMSDKDIEFIKLSASALSLDMSEQAFIENITEIRQKLEEQLGIVSHFNNQQVQVEDWYGSGSIMENTDLSDFPQ